MCVVARKEWGEVEFTCLPRSSNVQRQLTSTKHIICALMMCEDEFFLFINDRNAIVKLITMKPTSSEPRDYKYLLSLHYYIKVRERSLIFKNKIYSTAYVRKFAASFFRVEKKIVVDLRVVWSIWMLLFSTICAVKNGQSNSRKGNFRHLEFFGI